MLARLGHVCYRRRRLVVLAWVLAVVGGLGLGSQVFDRLGVSFEDSAIESFQGFNRLGDSAEHGVQVSALVDGPPVEDPYLARAVRTAAAEAAAVEGVVQVVTAYTVPAEVAAGLTAPGGTASLVQVDLARELGHDAEDRAIEEVTAILQQVEEGTDAEVLVGGDAVVQRELAEQSEADVRRGELVALPIVLVVLVVVFGGLVAAGVPLLGALGAVAGSLATLWVVSHVVDLDPSVPSVSSVLGLGLSIDYALLLLSRFREERAHGLDPEAAVTATMGTAGRTVLYSALTVAVSLSGLLLFDIDVFRGLAAAGASAVLFAMVTALTLVPALLAVAHRRIRPPRGGVRDDGGFARLARATQRRPLLVVAGCAVLLAGAASPFLHARFVNGTVELLPQRSESRQLAERVAERFPDRSAEPVLVVAEASPAELAAWGRDAVARPGVEPLVAGVGEARQRLDGVSLLAVVPDGASQGDEARALVEALREQRPDFPVWVTGDAAVLVDFLDEIAAGLPWALLWVGVATLVLLFLMTGSVLVPVKALVMNTLSLGATFGALVWVFQDGHGADLLGFTPVPGLETWVPVVTFAFAFGLSMDYEVFLLARVKELHDGGLSNDRAVELGLQRTGRIITSAALVMVIVCLGFATGEMLGIKQLGLALAVAVAVDATVVRMLLVPATMTLLGDRNWWAPAPLRRLHARFGLHEGPGAPGGSPATGLPDAERERVQA